MSTYNSTPPKFNSQPENLRDLLSEKHYQMLKESAIDDDVIKERGYRTIEDKTDLKELEFPPSQQIVPSLVIPVHLTNGESGLSVLRPDEPRIINGKIIKYEYPAKKVMTIDCPPRCQKFLDDPAIPLFITEGQKKADALASKGLCAVALHGVWNFTKKGTKKLLSDFDLIELDHRITYIVFESDIVSKSSVKQAMVNLGRLLKNNGARVKIVYLPSNENNSKVGVDDFFYNGGTVEQVKNYAVNFSTLDEKSTVEYEIADQLPIEMDRPIKLIEGKAYCVTPVPVRPKFHNQDSGTSDALTPFETRQLVICDDGESYGVGGTKSSDALPFPVKNNISVFPKNQWRPKSIKEFLNREKPLPEEVYKKIKTIIDQFIDFQNSLFDQEIMCEFVTCYILATWYIDAFSIIGYLWITGERGSGKTTLLHLISELGYLGFFILPSTTFASIRDLSDYGATLCIDDAEGVTNSNTTQYEKQNLYLAGNRKGAMIILKEKQPDGNWINRYVSVYCPKVFSAINKPDSVLSSRSIIIPVVKSIDPEKANADVTDYETWRFDRAEIIDALYGLTIDNLSKLAQLYREVKKESKVMGRELQPFGGLLAVAYWLETNGVSGIKDRMINFLVEYQTKRIDFEIDDRLALIVRSIFSVVANAINARSANQATKNSTSIIITVEAVHASASNIVKNENMDLYSLDLTNISIGRTLLALGLTKVPRKNGQGSRTWKITNNDIKRLSSSYNIEIPEKIIDFFNVVETPMDSNGICGETGLSGINDLTDYSMPFSPSYERGILPQDDESDYIESFQIIEPIGLDFTHKECYVCHQKSWKQRPPENGGGYYCSTCHPGLDDAISRGA